MSRSKLNQIPEREEVGPKPKPSNLNKRQLRALSTSSQFWLKTAKKGFFITSFSLLVFALFWPIFNAKNKDHDQIHRLNNAPPRKEMIQPVFSGQDENLKPYVLKATKAIVHQDKPDQNFNDSEIFMDFPDGEFLNEKNEKIFITADKGVYLPNVKFLKLNTNVHLITEDGHDFKTSSAVIDLRDSSAQGNEPVKGFGPQGDIRAEGFRLTNKGTKVTFIGNSQSQLYGKHAIDNE
ncbi:MAG: LPS export ABC transporter periplasmic protein LptC [Alphaproteobacteria bacterium]|nr:LPS export ABC transporter periplasmic protein LptC [Alphaproteobacteria bacterium]